MEITKEKIKYCTKYYLKKYFLMILAFMIIFVFAIVEVVASKHGLEFRKRIKVYSTVICLSLILIQIIINIIMQRKKEEKTDYGILIIIICLIVMFFVLSGVATEFGMLLNSAVFARAHEYVEDTDYGKKVVYVDAFFTSSDYEIHDYYNEFLWSRRYYSYSVDGVPKDLYLDREKIEEIIEKRRNGL